MDYYGKSKYEAEEKLKEIAGYSGMDLVIIRPPLIYGKNVKGNIALLIRAIQLGFPLPLAGINNKRSMIGIGNLISLIDTIIQHKKPLNTTFLASDDEDVSTTAFVEQLAIAMKMRSKIFPVPKILPQLAIRLLGYQSNVNKLFGSLQVDIAHTKNTLEWKPPNRVQEELNKMFSVKC
jgi:nucleoside-diphosphate-sugar epimerase